MFKKLWWSSKPFVWTEEEAAARLQISEAEVRALVEDCKLTAARVGGHFRFTDRDLSQFISHAGSLGQPKRKKLAAAVASAILLVSVTVWAFPLPVGQWGDQLRSQMWFSSAPTQLPPLDTAVGFHRTLTSEESAASGTAENLSLYMESLHNSTTRYPWPLYVELNTNHGNGADGVGIYSRLRTSGSGWGTGIHSEAIIRGIGTNIGYNAEMSPMVDGGRTIGLNIQAKNGYGAEIANKWSQEAINLQTDPNVGWDVGIKFDGARVNNGIHFTPASSGQRAIWVQGNYTVGLDMGQLPIRMNAGTPIQLEETSQITISFNQTAQRIEFKNGNMLLGYISALTDASGGKMN